MVEQVDECLEGGVGVDGSADTGVLSEVEEREAMVVMGEWWPTVK